MERAFLQVFDSVMGSGASAFAQAVSASTGGHQYLPDHRQRLAQLFTNVSALKAAFSIHQLRHSLGPAAFDALVQCSAHSSHDLREFHSSGLVEACANVCAVLICLCALRVRVCECAAFGLPPF